MDAHETAVASPDGTLFDYTSAAARSLDHAPLVMAIGDLTGRCIWVNAAVEEILGYSPDELIGKTAADLVCAEDAHDDELLFGQAAAGKIAAWERVKRVKAGDGTLAWVHARYWVVRDDDGEPEHVVAQLVRLSDRQACLHDAIRHVTDAAGGDDLNAHRATLEGLSASAATVLAAGAGAAHGDASHNPLSQLVPGWPSTAYNGASDPGATPAGAPPETQSAPESTEAFTVTLYEAAQLLNVSGSTLRRWADSGRLRCVRTSGGHRRFRLADIQRLRMKRHQPSEVRMPAYPARPLPFVAETFARYSSELASRTARCLYIGPPGWFERPESVAPVQELVLSLGRAFATGDFHEAQGAVRSCMQQAEVGGASLAERHAYIQTLDAVVRRHLREHGCPRIELAGAAQAAAAMTFQLIADNDR